MTSFWETLIHPDREENPERAEVARAANELQIGEFQLIQLAYRDWYDEDLPKALIDRLFAAYMLYSEVPPWGRRYARKILDLAERGELDDLDPAYHIYDADYHTYVPGGARRFAIAVCVVALCLGGGLLMAELTAGKALSMLPPYFQDKDLKQAQ